MPTVPVYNVQGEQVDEMVLADSVFAAPCNGDLLHQVLVGYLANRRRGTVGVKTRGQVSGGGRKMWRQKGTGRARQGSNRAPHWRGGGIVFGPQARDYRQGLPRRMRRGALRGALSARLAADRLRIVDDLNLERPRTRELLAIVGRLIPGDLRSLIITAEYDRNVYLSGRNVGDLAVTSAGDLNALDVVRAKQVLLTRRAAVAVEGMLAR